MDEILSLKKVKSIDGFRLKSQDITSRLKRADKNLLKTSTIDQLLNNSDVSQRNNLVLERDEIAATNPTLTGGKGSSLAILNAINNVTVPAFFCITTKAFTVQINSQKENLEKLELLSDELRIDGSQEKLKALFEQAALLRKQVEEAEIQKDIADSIENSYNKLCRENGELNVAVAVRSSATTEDTKDASFAGQHDTFLGQKGAADVIKSVRKCWGSIFTDRAVEYRSRKNIPHESAVMSVVVQVMVDPIVAGTSFSIEISTGFPAAHIAASYGLGESVVSGEVTSDEWLVDPNKLDIIKRVIGSKKTEYVMLSNASGTEIREVSEERRKALCMTDENVLSVAKSTLNIQKVYQKVFEYENVDTEFAMNKKGEVLLLQSRPVVSISSTDILTVDVKSVLQGSQIVKANYSLIGAVTGRCKIIRNFEDLVQGRVTIEPDDILVTAKTSNYWNQYLTSLKGIVTVDGSPTAHPMLIGRERNLTVLCGIPDLLERCQYLDGKIITIDGLTKWLYSGEIKLVKASQEEMRGQFIVQKPVEPKNDKETIKFLEQYNRLIIGDNSNELYTRNPNTKLSPAWIKIYQTMYKCRFPLVNSARENKLPTDPLSNYFKTIKGYNADLIVPNSVTMKVFEGMTLKECEAYHLAVDKAADNYLKACENFKNNPTVSNWKKYVETYGPLYASLWLSYFWRMYLKGLSSKIANKIGMSSFHYNEMLQYTQEQLIFKEEDSKLHQSYVKIAEEIRSSVLSEKETKELAISGKLMTLSQKTIIAIAMMSGKLKEKINYIGESFRLHKNTDISLESQTALVVELITEAIQQGATCSQAVEGDNNNITYYPKCPELTQAINLHMYSRIQNSNCHHYKIRGQWMIRRGLQKIANQLGENLDKIISLQTPDEIENYISKYEKESKTKNSLNNSSKGGLKLIGAFAAGLFVGLFSMFYIKKKSV